MEALGGALRAVGAALSPRPSSAGPGLPNSCVDVVVIGAGISGLVCAEKLTAAQRSVTVLEARERVGGRLLSQQGVDLGASWRWPGMDSRASSIAKRLGITEVPQQLSGTAYVSQGSRAQNIGNSGARMAPCGPGAMRFSGGYQSLPLKLQAESTATIELGCQVTSITQGPESIKITYEGADGNASIDAQRVVLALPSGVLASTIQFEPPLPEKQLQKMRTTATWCGDWCKVVATFKSAFWRERGESGVVATQGLPIQVWWEGGAGPAEGDAVCALVGLGVGEDGACAGLRTLHVPSIKLGTRAGSTACTAPPLCLRSHRAPRRAPTRSVRSDGEARRPQQRGPAAQVCECGALSGVWRHCRARAARVLRQVVGH